MKALVTRPAAEAADLASALARRGIAALNEPLLAIRFLPEGGATLDALLAGVQAVLFTSANGARAFAAATAKRDLAVFAVGDATAAAAAAAGFAAVKSAQGNVEDLAALVIATLKPGDGALLHAAGSVSAGDLAARLGAAGFELRRAVLYEAVPATHLSPETEAALQQGEVDVALFFSPRSAATFVRLAAAAGLGERCRAVTAIGLSPAVATALGAIAWRDIAIAAAPNQAALLAALDRIALSKERESKLPMNEAPKPQETAPPPALPAPPQQLAARRAGFISAFALVVLVLALVGSAPFWAPALMPLLPWGRAPVAAQPDETAALAQRLAAAEERIAALSQKPPPSEAPPQPQNNQDRLAALALLSQMQSELRRLDQSVHELSARVDQSDAQIAQLESRPSAGSEDANRLLLVALGELRGALETSRPFAAELATVAALAHDRPEIGTALGRLEPAAQTGLPSTAVLARQFSDQVAPEILRADITAPAENQTLGQRILAKLRSLVVIRRIDAGAHGDAVEIAVAAAESALGQGDLAGAVKALDGLTGPAQAAARGWLAQAQQRLAAETALAKLSESVAADLATGGGG